MAVPKSYFPIVTHKTNFLGSDYFTSLNLRGDHEILRRQRAVGWSFFSHANVERLLQVVRKVNLKADFDDIMEEMVAVYEANASDTYVVPGKEWPIVEKLNELFIKRWGAGVNRKIDYHRFYQDYLQQPNPIKPRPQQPNQRDATTVMYEKNLRNYAEDSQSGGNYVNRTRSNIMPKDAEQLKFYITPLDSDYY